jgi:hypothetical protein
VNRVSRLGGALLLDSGGAHFLVGDLKRPCDFSAAGFVAPPGPIDAVARPFVRLARTSGDVNVPGPWLDLGDGVRDEALAGLLAQRLVITRNGSVSDRLWRLILSPDPEIDELPPASAVIDARWLVEMPGQLWQIVRDAVLKCT